MEGGKGACKTWKEAISLEETCPRATSESSPNAGSWRGGEEFEGENNDLNDPLESDLYLRAITLHGMDES